MCITSPFIITNQDKQQKTHIFCIALLLILRKTLEDIRNNEKLKKKIDRF